MLTLLEAKIYLRVDTSEEDDLIKVLIATSEELCKDVLRVDELVERDPLSSVGWFAKRGVLNENCPFKPASSFQETCDYSR